MNADPTTVPVNRKHTASVAGDWPEPPKIIRDARTLNETTSATSVSTEEEQGTVKRRVRTFTIMHAELSALQTSHYLILVLVFIQALVASIALGIAINMPVHAHTAGATALIVFIATILALGIISRWQRSIIHEVKGE